MLGDRAYGALEVRVGGYVVPRDLWANVTPKPGQCVHITAIPQGGNGGKWLRTILLIVVAVLSIYTGGLAAAAYGSLAGAAVGAAVGIVGSLLVNALIPPPTPKGLNGSGDPFSQLASITGTSNQANPYGVIPCVVGKMRFFPPHAALPYTETLGDD